MDLVKLFDLHKFRLNLIEQLIARRKVECGESAHDREIRSLCEEKSEQVLT